MNTLEFALAYAHAYGFSLLPLTGKEPATRPIKKTHGTGSTKRLAEVGADEEHLRTWFADPGVNIGVFCGEPSGGLVVVDFDDCEFPLAGSRLPLTPTVKTGGDRRAGLQLYYRSSEPVGTQKAAWGEVRGWPASCGRGALYVAAPPSRHPHTGRQYVWQLPPDEVPFADFSSVELPERRPQRARSLAIGETLGNSEPTSPIRPTEDLLLGRGTTRDKKGEGWLAGFDADEASVEAMARALGIDAPLGSPFLCVLHPESSASAALYRVDESGHWLYHDFHHGKYGSPGWLTLAGVRALKAGRGPKLSPSELATWKLILLVEAGVLPLVAVPAESLPGDTAGFVQHLFERFVFLLGARWNYDHGAPAPLERNFAAALAGLPVRLAREAIDELQRLGRIYVAGMHGRTRLWLPAGCSSREIGMPL